MIEFFAAGTPKGQPRPRAFAMKGKAGKVSARVYDAGTAEGWKGAVALAARPHLPAQPIDWPLTVTLEFHLPRPKGHYGTGRNASVLKSSAPEVHTCKPDVDNLAKAVLDALTHLGVWRDDTHITELTVRKRWADGRPGCRVVIEVELPE